MSSNSPRVKKPHYVQQSYLAGFSNDGHIHVFDKSLRRQFTSHIRDICSERSFYDLEGMEELTGKEQQLESFFHGFEDAGVKVIRDNIGSIRDGAFTTLPQSERIDLALFLAVQHLRTKRTREIAGSLLESISKDAFLDHMRRTQPDFPIEDWLSVDADERARFAAHFYLVTNEDVRVAVSGCCTTDAGYFCTTILAALSIRLTIQLWSMVIVARQLQLRLLTLPETWPGSSTLAGCFKRSCPAFC